MSLVLGVTRQASILQAHQEFTDIDMRNLLEILNLAPGREDYKSIPVCLLGVIR